MSLIFKEVLLNALVVSIFCNGGFCCRTLLQQAWPVDMVSPVEALKEAGGVVGHVSKVKGNPRLFSSGKCWLKVFKKVLVAVIFSGFWDFPRFWGAKYKKQRPRFVKWCGIIGDPELRSTRNANPYSAKHQPSDSSRNRLSSTDTKWKGLKQ